MTVKRNVGVEIDFDDVKKFTKHGNPHYFVENSISVPKELFDSGKYDLRDLTERCKIYVTQYDDNGKLVRMREFSLLRWSQPERDKSMIKLFAYAGKVHEIKFVQRESVK